MQIVIIHTTLTAGITPVRGNMNTIGGHILKNELVCVAAEVMQTGLHHMIAVKISYKGNQIVLEGANHH